MIAVIGGTGFIGKNLVLTLQRAGRSVLSVSRQPDRAFLAEHAPDAEAMTLSDFHADPAAVLFGVDALVYLASSSTPGSNLQAPWHEATDNVEPLLRMLKAVQVHRPQAHFIFLSSGGTVYGQTSDALISEQTDLHPISAYGMGKKMMEAAVGFMADHHGLSSTVLRPANPVGLWQKSRSQGVVGALLRAAHAETPFPMMGDGGAIRDYFDVADLCDAILDCIAQPNSSIGQIFNVGSGQGWSVRQIYDLVCAVTGRDIMVESVPARNSDVDRVVLDTARIEAALGWRPTRALEDTVRAIWENWETVR